MSTVYEPGDLVFVDIDNPIYRRVGTATGTWTNHVGMVLEAGAMTKVIESRVPTVSITTINAFMRRSRHRRAHLCRFRNGLTSAQAEALVSTARQHLGQPYHLGFNADSRWTFCSKFIHHVYRDALGLRLGYHQTLAEIAAAKRINPAWWHTWYAGRPPWQQRTITPASLLEDAQLTTIARYHTPETAKTSSPVI